MRKYRLVAKKGEGTFSEVLKAQNVKTSKYHAIKCMKNHFDSIDQVNNLREIQALRRLSPHSHIITLEEVLYDQPTGRLALVFELMDANLYELIRGRRHYLNPNLIKSYVYQLLKALDHMHRKGIFHRDIKPENILIAQPTPQQQTSSTSSTSTSTNLSLKLADFGSCRGIYSKQPYTEYISTRWYRSPECLLTDGYYGPEMDLWGSGCVFFEITSLYPLFPGGNEVDQINRIHKVLGTPSAAVLAKFKDKGNAAALDFETGAFGRQGGIGIGQLVPHASEVCVDLMVKTLKYDFGERISAREGLRHAYFKDVRDGLSGGKDEAKSEVKKEREKEKDGSHTERSDGTQRSKMTTLSDHHGSSSVSKKKASAYKSYTNSHNSANHHNTNSNSNSNNDGVVGNSSLPPIGININSGNNNSESKHKQNDNSNSSNTTTYRTSNNSHSHSHGASNNPNNNNHSNHNNHTGLNVTSSNLLPSKLGGGPSSSNYGNNHSSTHSHSHSHSKAYGHNQDSSSSSAIPPRRRIKKKYKYADKNRGYAGGSNNNSNNNSNSNSYGNSNSNSYGNSNSNSNSNSNNNSVYDVGGRGYGNTNTNTNYNKYGGGGYGSKSKGGGGGYKY